jgi:branched-chain amino acid transport system permease protein
VTQYVIVALSIGSIYALYALGIGFIFGVARILNFAHGAFITVGAYVTFHIMHLPTPVVVGGTLLAPVLLAVVTERMAFRPVRRADATTFLIMSFALATFIQNGVIVIEGLTQKAVKFGGDLARPVEVVGLTFSGLDLGTIAVTLAVLVAISLLLTRTSIGIEIRAVSEDSTMAQLLGVDPTRVIRVAFAISGFLAGIAAIQLVIQLGSLAPDIGFQPVIIAFVATILGGMGSLVGAAVGGYVLGFLTVVLQVLLPSEYGAYRDAVLFLIVIVMLLFKPSGLVASRLLIERV